MSEITVSIICNAYNHEQYIRDAIEGFLCQKTDFKYEILIHDDASTDSTADIINQYAEKYPDLIKPICQKENQYSQGKRITQIFQYPRVRGKYIAFCEGDDYWSDPLKLQKQVDALEKNPYVDICAHATNKIDSKTGKVLNVISPSKGNDLLSLEQVIMGGGGYVATNSLMYRRDLCTNIPDFRKFLDVDYAIQIHGSLRGGMLFLGDNMSCYRWLSEGSWTKNVNKDEKLKTAFWKKLIDMLRMVDKELNYEYSDLIRCRILMEEENYTAIFKQGLQHCLKYLQKEIKFKIWAKGKFPCLLRIKRRFVR